MFATQMISQLRKHTMFTMKPPSFYSNIIWIDLIFYDRHLILPLTLLSKVRIIFSALLQGGYSKIADSVDHPAHDGGRWFRYSLSSRRGYLRPWEKDDCGKLVVQIK